MPLSGLVLLDVIDQDFQTSVHATVVQVESKASNLQRLAPALVLASTDSRSQSVEDLIVPAEESLGVHGIVSAINCWIESARCDHHAFVCRRDAIVNESLDLLLNP
jgi:hypothetical protein